LTLLSEILARRMRLPRAESRDLVCERDLPAAMEDGAVLLADRWVARRTRHTAQPTVLVRSPYGRRQVLGLLFGRLMAERGLQVVIQSVRGTFGSEGSFSPFDERADGLATLRWIRRQPWHSDRIGMIGPSYLGFVQWAVAGAAGEDLAAMAIQVSASEFYGQTYAGGSLSLETVASWLVLVSAQESHFGAVTIARALRRLPALFSELPLAEFDRRATGAEVAWFQAALTNRLPGDPYWAARDFTGVVSDVTTPVQFVGGWHDILLPWMLRDFGALQAAGRDVQLIVGPWTHTAPGLMGAGHREGLAWLRAHLLDDDRLRRPARVRIFVTGEGSAGGWRQLPSWPPPGTGQRRLWLGDGQGLAEEGPRGAPAASDRYTYDPADPTPSLGGPTLLGRHAVVDNRPLESRADVLSYTTAALSEPLEAIGPVAVELWLRASSRFFDVFARLCDVDRRDASWNVCDALINVGPERSEPIGDGVWRVLIDLWPTAHRFAAGHRIRLQVSSGAYPRYARNPGTGEDPAIATMLAPVDIELLRGELYPSALILPWPAARGR
jgi:putative CocE/NonD family hydrolase